jgi:GNAT superfamily N-acetyltransferase
VRVAEYDASRRADVAELMQRVWGDRPADEELAWFYERNPVRPASVLLGEEDGRVVATVAISFLRMSIGGAEVEVGMPLRVATDPEYRGRGLFAELQAANEARARELGIRLLLTVPNDASAPVFLRRLEWRPLPPLRVWARVRVLPRPVLAWEVERFTTVEDARVDEVVLRDVAWMNWRFADAPRRYRLFERNDDYAIYGRLRRGLGFVAATQGDGVAQSLGAVGEPALIATARAGEGWLPTHRTFTVLGKALDRTQPLPERPHFELGDLDFL